jgi:toxin ParE1/3/4
MARDVVVLRQAERDLEEIYDFVESHDGQGAADRFRAGLGKALASLSTLLARGNVPWELRSLGVTDYREIRWTVYRIIYRVTPERVVVHCVLDGRRDMQRILQRRLLH